jgi:NADPH-dependent glutamate synthase beta subunit-like oxidoreductase
MIRNIYSYSSLKQLDNEFTAYRLDSSLRGDDSILKDAIQLEQFLTIIFPIEGALQEFQAQAKLWEILSEFKVQFVQRRALRKYSKNDVAELTFDNQNIHKFATEVLEWLKDEASYEKELDQAMQYVAYKAYRDPDHSVFILPKKLDFENLVDPDSPYKKKEGFSEANYCIYCHNQEKDSCRNGMEEKTKHHDNAPCAPLDDRVEYAHNPLDNTLSGCPLKQKISEMNYLYAKGNIIAALAITMIDNPLVAATGHRVCNDCMKSCIFQKQEPVDIPCVESDMLRDVLLLPYGAEIYYLLTRWNPLENYIAKENSHGKALVAGMGPAGFALSYYLLREGHFVTGVDSMEISKLDERFFKPIANWKETVGTYKPQGFGGVSEYGITDRWDKSNLLLIRMILERFPNFELKDKMKLGEDISLKEAGKNNDYIALCLGAGQPNLPQVKNADAKGIISAFDFLMERNIGSSHPDGPIGLGMDPVNTDSEMLCIPAPGFLGCYAPLGEVLAPVIILGAGLTAIDCALEAIKCIDDVTILYRKSMRESPSYRENHDELQIALDKGIKCTENTNLESIELDESGRIKSVNGSIPARTLVFAFGTGYNDQILLDEPDVAMAYKDKIGIFGDLDPKYTGSVVKAIASSKDGYKAVSKKLLGE